MTNITFRDGRLPPRPEADAPRMKFAQIRTVTPDLPKLPCLVDYVTKVLTWPMYANDRWGDCVWAAIGHMIQAATTYGRGETVTVTDDDLLKAYSAVTGFDPNAGDPGSNPTDNGTVIQDALDYWRRIGIAGHQILAFAQVDVHDLDEVDAALYLFGHLELGINFPASAMNQFDAGQPWDVVEDDGGNEGGHAVNLGYAETAMRSHLFGGRPLVVGRNARGNYEIVTWERVVEMTPSFFQVYVEEAWVVITPEWYDAQGRNPEGIDEAALGEVFTALTGEPFPFPGQPAAESGGSNPGVASATVGPAELGDLSGRHPATVGLARFFESAHLPDHLQAVSGPCGALAELMIAAVPDGPELTAGLRKLLEAKDCFVRAALPPKE